MSRVSTKYFIALQQIAHMQMGALTYFIQKNRIKMFSIMEIGSKPSSIKRKLMAGLEIVGRRLPNTSAKAA
jgi:hypothetical protein